MLDRKFFIPLEASMACVAAIAILIGALIIHFVGWKTVGWMAVLFGAETFLFAYFFANATEYEIGEVMLQDE